MVSTLQQRTETPRGMFRGILPRRAYAIKNGIVFRLGTPWLKVLFWSRKRSDKNLWPLFSKYRCFQKISSRQDHPITFLSSEAPSIKISPNGQALLQKRLFKSKQVSCCNHVHKSLSIFMLKDLRFLDIFCWQNSKRGWMNLPRGYLLKKGGYLLKTSVWNSRSFPVSRLQWPIS